MQNPVLSRQVFTLILNTFIEAKVPQNTVVALAESLCGKIEKELSPPVQSYTASTFNKPVKKEFIPVGRDVSSLMGAVSQ